MLFAEILVIFAIETAHLLIIVKSLLRYIIPVVLAVITLICGVGDADTYVSDNHPSETFATEIATCYIDVTPDANMYLSHQVPSSQVLRLKKNNSNKYFLGLVKACKIPSTGIGNFVQRKSLIIHSSFIKPAHKLICLGKLVI